MVFGALFNSSDIPTTAFDDRLAYQTGEQGGTGSPEPFHIFTSFRRGVTAMAGHPFNLLGQLHCSNKTRTKILFNRLRKAIWWRDWLG